MPTSRDAGACRRQQSVRVPREQRADERKMAQVEGVADQEGYPVGTGEGIDQAAQPDSG